jgi:nucleoside phosphorylase
MSESPSVVILTPLNLEYRAVRVHLKEPRKVWHPDGTAAEIGTVSGVPWPVAVVVMGEGTYTASTMAERVSKWLKPRALFLVGVAGGLKDDINLGDVVVATLVYGYHSGKETDSGFETRPRSWPTSHRMVQAARHAEVAGVWADGLPALPSVHFKPIASGDVVLNSRTSPLAVQLQDDYNDAVAIEMESTGVVCAAQLNETLPVLTVRGISDKADDRKQVNDAAGLQPAAAAHAAAFTMAILRELSAAMAAESQTVPDSRAPIDPGRGWRALAQPLPAIWLPDLGVPSQRGKTIVELCLLPAGPIAPLEARQLAALPAELTTLGRAAAVFTSDQDVSETCNTSAVADAAGAGLAITRNGERCGWKKLPQDLLGSVLDQEDLTARLAALLSALTGLDAPCPQEAGVAVAVTPSVLLAEGRVADLPRTSARGRTSLTPLRVPAADVLPWARIAADPADVSAELSARLLLAFRSRQRQSSSRG